MASNRTLDLQAAADKLAAVTAERDAARRERDEYADRLGSSSRALDEVEREVDALRAELVGAKALATLVDAEAVTAIRGVLQQRDAARADVATERGRDAMPDLPGGPSEAAMRRAKKTHASSTCKFGAGCDWCAHGAAYGPSAAQILDAAHDPALGTDRSVNAAWCRADQTRLIVEWLRENAECIWTSPRTVQTAADRITREFGGGSDAD